MGEIIRKSLYTEANVTFWNKACKETVPVVPGVQGLAPNLTLQSNLHNFDKKFLNCNSSFFEFYFLRVFKSVSITSLRIVRRQSSRTNEQITLKIIKNEHEKSSKFIYYFNVIILLFSIEGCQAHKKKNLFMFGSLRKRTST